MASIFSRLLLFSSLFTVYLVSKASVEGWYFSSFVPVSLCWSEEPRTTPMRDVQIDRGVSAEAKQSCSVWPLALRRHQPSADSSEKLMAKPAALASNFGGTALHNIKQFSVICNIYQMQKTDWTVNWTNGHLCDKIYYYFLFCTLWNIYYNWNVIPLLSMCGFWPKWSTSWWI